MSDSFRDLERPESAHRKDAVLMAAISGLEYLDRPSRQDLARFSKLFLPMFEAASAATLQATAAQKRSDVEGVSLDEELAAMTLYQQSYNAAARMLQAAKEMTDTLMGIV